MVDALHDTEGNYEELQKRQMMKGLASDGGKIGEYASEDYAEEKFRLSDEAGFGNVDLRLHGPFQNRIKVEVSDEGIDVDSDDEKTEALVEKYGKRIWTLNDNSRQEFVDGLYPIVIYRVEKNL